VKLYVLFGQRRCLYPGQHAPEALCCSTEFSHMELPSWLNGELAKVMLDPEFVSAAIVHVTLSDDAMKAIDDRLTGTTTVSGCGLMSDLLTRFVELVSRAAPLSWVACQNMEDAQQWEKDALALLQQAHAENTPT